MSARNRGILATMLLAGVAGALAWAATAAELEPADFTFNNGSEPSSLDPAGATSVYEGRILRAIYEGLVVKHPRTLAPLPGSAESWDISADGLRYRFRIRADARWTNGDPVTAGDFAWTFERLLRPDTASPYAYLLWHVRGARAFTTEVDERGQPLHAFDSVAIRAEDERALVLELEHPTPYLLDLLGYYPLFPVHRASLEEAQRRWPDTWRSRWLRPEHLVTNGPFRLVERRLNDRIRLQRNEDYWDAASVAFRTIDALSIEDATTGLNLYLTGGIDLVDVLPASAVPRLLPREDFDPGPQLGSYFYRVNVTRPPLDDARVRRALALAIDRIGICERITKAGEQPLSSLVPPGLPGWPPAGVPRHAGGSIGEARERAGPDFSADCERARALLAEAGFGPGRAALRPIEIHYNTDVNNRDVAEYVAATWREQLGLDVRLRNQERKVWLDTQSGLDYDVSRSVWIADYADATSFLDVFRGGGENNRTGWASARYDALLEQARREPDPERRLRLLAEAEGVLLEELPILPIYAYVTRNLVNPRLGGFHENALDEHFPKFWYWKDDAELALERASLAPDVVRVTARGPSAGLYPRAARRAPPRE